MKSSLQWHLMSPAGTTADGVPLLLIHGWLGNAQDWHAVAQSLPSHHPIVAVDLPGHGATAPWEATAVNFHTIGDAIADVVHHVFKKTRPILVGYSMGGRVALQLLRARPHLCSGLVLIAAHPGLLSSSDRAARRAIDAQRALDVATSSWESFIRRWYELAVFQSLASCPSVREALIQRRLALPPSAPAALVEALSLGNQPPPPATMPHPLLLIAGARDSTYRNLYQEIAITTGAALSIIPDAGHALLYENPTAVAQAIEEFLQPMAGSFSHG